ncbi:MAG: bifunctional DNA-formamidopyrimidine glycosylase/DNA-(apurinic or apyrimidinic site) lyase [Alphaproteobacteria bacterium]|nr:bifunctional DNA-formamidopyrimidine glycosylase/DNA-(apurinic or apyrimidinic site) lyase [Alphaproteobacteria bacterium]
MPELPEVETVCRGLRGPLEGRRLVRVEQRRPNLRFPIPERFPERLTGRTVLRVERRAKFILITLDDDTVLIAHLGMSGRMTILDAATAPPPGPHDHVEFETDQGALIRYCDPRRFGMMDLTTTAALGSHRMIEHLGPEPLGNAFNAESLSQALAGKKTPIKAALLDQKVVAGLGNIYICEALHRAGISPRRSAYTVPGQRAERLTLEIRAVLREAIDAGGSSLRDYVQASGDLGYFQHNWQVYGREGEACRRSGCSGTVRRIVQSGRSTFYCATHQR